MTWGPHISTCLPPLLVDHRTISLELISCLYHRCVCVLSPYVRAAPSAARAVWTTFGVEPKAPHAVTRVSPVLTTWTAVLCRRSRAYRYRTRRPLFTVLFEAILTWQHNPSDAIYIALSEPRISSKIMLFWYHMLQAQHPSHWTCC